MIVRALCSIALTIRRDLLVRELRDISGYNLSAARIPIAERSQGEGSDMTEGSQDYTPEAPNKRKQRKRNAE